MLMRKQCAMDIWLNFMVAIVAITYCSTTICGNPQLTSVLLQNINLQWKITNDYCSLKFVHFKEEQNPRGNLDLSWGTILEFGEPFETVVVNPESDKLRLKKDDSLIPSSQNLGRAKSWCTTIAVLMDVDVINPTTVNQVKKVGRVLHDNFVFILPLDGQSRLPEPAHLLVHVVKSKYIMSANAAQMIYYYVEPYKFTGKFVQISSSQRSRIFQKFRNRVNGRTVNFTSAILPPYMVGVETPEGSKGGFRYSGSHGILYFELCKQMNFTLNVIYVSKLASGTQLANGTWTGSFGLLTSGQVEILGATGMSLPRSSIIDFGMESAREQLIFCLTEPKAFLKWEAIFLPLTLGVWGYTLLVFLVIAVLMYVYEKKAHLIQEHDGGIHERLENICEIVLVPLGMFLEQAFPMAVSKNFVAVIWLFCSLIIGTSYKSNLVGFLTLPVKPSFPRTFASLNEHKEFTLYGHSLGGLEKGIWESPNTAVTKGISKRIKFLTSAEKCLREATKPNTACIGWKNILRTGVSRYLVSRNNKNPLYVAQQPVATGLGSFGTKKGSLFFDVFNRFSVYSVAGGLINKWVEDYIQAARRAKIQSPSSPGARPKDSRAENEGNAKPLQMANLFAVFWILYFGFAVATLGAIVEMVMNGLSQNHKFHHRISIVVLSNS